MNRTSLFNLYSKTPVPGSVEKRILTYLKKKNVPIRQSLLLSTDEIGPSTIPERTRSMWNLVDTGKIVILDDRRIQIVR
jgi:hypothetical protein